MGDKGLLSGYNDNDMPFVPCLLFTTQNRLHVIKINTAMAININLQLQDIDLHVHYTVADACPIPLSTDCSVMPRQHY